MKQGNIEKYSQYLKTWSKGIEYEISFWDKWIKTRGDRWPEDFKNRLNPTTPIWHDIGQLIEQSGKDTVNILDVGSGPITNLGYTYKDIHIKLQACDPLAGAYLHLYNRYNVHPPVKTQFAMAEKLTEVFEQNFFDMILCNNALDHSFDPVAGISEMIAILKPGGTIRLSHNENEAECENYSGFHQWNFTEKDNNFIIWNKDEEYNITSMFAAYANVTVTRVGEKRNWISVNIIKTNQVEEIRIYPKYIVDYGLVNQASEKALEIKDSTLQKQANKAIENSHDTKSKKIQKIGFTAIIVVLIILLLYIIVNS